MRATPSAPTIAGIAEGRRRACTALPSANAMKPPMDAVTSTTNQVSTLYGAGASWKSISIPTASATRPDNGQRSVRDDVRVDRRAARAPRTISAKPAQLDRQDREAEQRGHERDRAERAGQHDARMEDLEEDAADAGEEEQRQEVRVDQRVEQAREETRSPSSRSASPAVCSVTSRGFVVRPSIFCSSAGRFGRDQVDRRSCFSASSRGEVRGLANGEVGPLRVASVRAREVAKRGRRVVDDLALQVAADVLARCP